MQEEAVSVAKVGGVAGGGMKAATQDRLMALGNAIEVLISRKPILLERYISVPKADPRYLLDERVRALPKTPIITTVMRFMHEAIPEQGPPGALRRKTRTHPCVLQKPWISGIKEDVGVQAGEGREEEEQEDNESPDAVEDEGEERER